MRDYVLGLINAAWTTQAIAACVDLRIPDLLAARSATAATLASATGCHAPSLRRLLRALATLDLVEERDDDTFALTTAGALLRTDAADSLAWWARLAGGRIWSSWSTLADTVRSGQSARRLAGGHDDFRSFEEDAAAADAFARAMGNLTRPIAQAVAAKLDFASAKRIVDVGGGHGHLLSAILSAHPAMHGVLFDLPQTIASARNDPALAGLADRCTLVAGDFFDGVPEDADAYLLKSILHDWDDARCATILERCRHAVHATAQLHVIERLRPARFAATGSHRAIARSDLNMLVSLGGRERTLGEYRELLACAGFRIAHTTPLTAEFSAITALPATR